MILDVLEDGIFNLRSRFFIKKHLIYLHDSRLIELIERYDIQIMRYSRIILAVEFNYIIIIFIIDTVLHYGLDRNIGNYIITQTEFRAVFSHDKCNLIIIITDCPQFRDNDSHLSCLNIDLYSKGITSRYIDVKRKRIFLTLHLGPVHGYRNGILTV